MDIPATFRLALNALLLRPRAFEEMRDDPQPFARGLSFILLIAVLVALVSIVGNVLFWLSSPDLEQIQTVVWEQVRQMPWVEQIPETERAQVLSQVKQVYDLAWLAARTLTPGILRALLNVFLSPVALVAGWLVYGFLAFLVARMLGGQGGLEQTYGATALAAAPRLLGVVNVLPYVETAGLGIWALICNYLALKTTHNLTPWRAFWATVLPLVLLFLLALGLGIIGIAVVTATVGGGA